MKKLLSLIVVSMFMFSAAGWNFNAKELRNANLQKNTISSIGNSSKMLSYASLNAPKKAAKKSTKKLIHKTTTVTKKATHKKGSTTTTTITTKTTKHK